MAFLRQIADILIYLFLFDLGLILHPFLSELLFSLLILKGKNTVLLFLQLSLGLMAQHVCLRFLPTILSLQTQQGVEICSQISPPECAESAPQVVQIL